MTGYEPLNTLKPVAENIWVVDGEAISFGGLPYTTRMTIVRLENGDLFLHSPIAITDELKAAVAALGTIKHLVSPNWIHYFYMAGWSDEFPDAIVWASPGVRKRAIKFKVPLQFDRDLGEHAEEPWAGQIEQIIVGGNIIHHEVVFFHKASKTLILTDLIENFEAKHIPGWFRPLAWMTGILDPDGRAPVDMRIGFLFGKKKVRAAAQTMLAWQPEKVIVSHGRWYDKDGVTELKRAFRWAL